MKSLMPWAEYIFMMCQSTGRPPISTMGFGRIAVSSLRRVPIPPARMTAFILLPRTKTHDCPPQNSRRRQTALPIAADTS